MTTGSLVQTGGGQFHPKPDKQATHSAGKTGRQASAPAERLRNAGTRKNQRRQVDRAEAHQNGTQNQKRNFGLGVARVNELHEKGQQKQNLSLIHISEPTRR